MEEEVKMDDWDTGSHIPSSPKISAKENGCEICEGTCCSCFGGCFELEQENNAKVAPPLPPRTYLTSEKYLTKYLKHKTGWTMSQESIVLVSIPGHNSKVDLLDKSQKPFTVYYVQVQARNGQGWTLEKRFSEFYSFSKSIRIKKDKNGKKIAFPSRFSSKSNFSEKLIEYRRRTLEQYLQTLLGLRETNSALNEVLDVFLEAERAKEGQLPSRTRNRSHASSFKVSLPESGSLDFRDRIQLQSRELINSIAKAHPKFVMPAKKQSNKPSVDLDKIAKLTGCDHRERILLELGRLVALQQKQVDAFAGKMLKEYPDKLFRELNSIETTKEKLNGLDEDDSEVVVSSDDGSTPEEQEKKSSRSLKSSSSTISKTMSRAERYLSTLLSKSPPKKAENEVAEQMLYRVHRYLAQISWKVLKVYEDKLAGNYNLGFGEDFHFDALYRLFEVAMIKRHPELCNRVTLAAQACDGVYEKDQVIFTKMQFLQTCFDGCGIPPSIFDATVHPNFDLNQQGASSSGLFAWGWESVVENLNRLENYETYAIPSAKAEVILSCIKEIHRAIESSVAPRTDANSVPKPLGADDFVPTFFYIIACSKLRHPCAIHKYICSLASDALMDTEAKYWLTVFESGLHFISCLDLQETTSNFEQTQLE